MDGTARLERQPTNVSALRVAVVTETYLPEVNGVAMTMGRLVRGLCARGHCIELVKPRQRPPEGPAQRTLRGVARARRADSAIRRAQDRPAREIAPASALVYAPAGYRAPRHGRASRLVGVASVMPHASSGKLRVIGISSLKRSALAPQVPTLSESGLNGFEYTTWYGMLMPGRTPKAIVDHAQASTAHVLKSPQIAERLTAQGLQTYGSTPSEFDRYLRAEVDKWAKVIRAADSRVD